MTEKNKQEYPYSYACLAKTIRGASRNTAKTIAAHPIHTLADLAIALEMKGEQKDIEGALGYAGAIK